MTTDLWMLAASVALTWILIMVAATKNGLVWAAANRDEAPPMTGAAGRADRLASNMLENLPLFTALVLTAHVSGTADDLSAQGAQVFFYARIGHAACYLIGIPWLRTLVWAVSVAGMGMIGASIFS